MRSSRSRSKKRDSDPLPPEINSLLLELAEIKVQTQHLRFEEKWPLFMSLLSDTILYAILQLSDDSTDFAIQCFVITVQVIELIYEVELDRIFKRLKHDDINSLIIYNLHRSSLVELELRFNNFHRTLSHMPHPFLTEYGFMADDQIEYDSGFMKEIYEFYLQKAASKDG